MQWVRHLREGVPRGRYGLVDGKARLMRDDYCDGLGDCLPACPTGAITFVEREAAAYDEAAVLANKAKVAAPVAAAGGCPGSRMQVLRPAGRRPDAPARARNQLTMPACGN
ncbi:MAG: hypothetical protein V8T51_07820 [Senegalimassilia faecalis]